MVSHLKKLGNFRESGTKKKGAVWRPEFFYIVKPPTTSGA